MSSLHLLCAGAAQGLVKALQLRFHESTGASLEARFGAVGAMKERLLAGEPCDLLIVTAGMIDSLVAEGRLRGETRAALGRVRTGIAVQRGAPHPDLSTPEALKAALQAASAIYFPDAERSTAGIHFARVMQELGIHEHPKAGRGRPPPAGIEESGKATFPQEALQPRFRTYPSGAIAMREMAAAAGPGLIGCTQVTEIKYTEGVELVGLLPQRFELATVYSAAATAGSAERVALAQNFIGLLTGADTLALRTAGGFEA